VATDPKNVLYTLWPFATAPDREREVPWPEEIRERITEHVNNEHSIMIEYEKLAEDATAEDVRFLMQVVLDDERRHHRWFRELRNSLDAAIELRSVGATIPPVGSEPVSPALLEATERLLEVEHEDAQELKALRKALKPVEGTTLWSLLVEIMEHDTQKHIAILEYIRRLVRERVQE
jgi:rubrerythrin